jgi:hypothetical protein
MAPAGLTIVFETAEDRIPKGLARRSLGLGAAALSAGLLAQVFIGGTGPGSRPAPPELVIRLNHAPVPVVEALPRVGPVIASAIVKARGKIRFRSIEDLRARVSRIGPVTAAALLPHLRFDDSGPPSDGLPSSEP